MRGAGRPGCGCGRMWQRDLADRRDGNPTAKKGARAPRMQVQQAGPVGRGDQARVGEEGTGGMLLCVLVLFTLVGGLKSSLKGLYGHLLAHTSYFKK